MDAITLQDSGRGRPRSALLESVPTQMIDAAQFHRLLVSHRRMIRADRRDEQLRGLQDLDTGEVFLIDEPRLLDPRR